MKTLLQVQDLCVSYGRTHIVEDVSFSLDEGQWLMLVGPNGAGKSTIVKAVMQDTEYSGDVLYRGKNVRGIRPGERARYIGALSQNYSVGFAYTVGEVVRLGRYAYGKGLFRSSAPDSHVENALRLTGMTELADHSVLQLSGGELQRTFLAQVFAQDPKILILDEPTNHLDLIYQKQVFSLITDWLRQPGRAAISVVHDLSLARAYGTEALLLDKGRIAAQGPVRKVLSSEYLDGVYGMDVCRWMGQMLGQWN